MIGKVLRPTFCVLWFVSVLVCSVAAAQTDETAASPELDGSALIEATQKNDAGRVAELLAAGVDINSTTRYGATALFFAADKGNVELVKTLVQKGAEINVTDTFYSATPLTWALFKAGDSAPHKEIAVVLLAAGADEAGAALTFAAQSGDLELAQAAIATGKAAPDEIRSALKMAETGSHSELADYLKEKAPAEQETETVQIAAETLNGFTGDYKNDQIGLGTKIFLEGEELKELKLQATGQQAVTLDATAETSFKAREVPGIELTFSGRGGLTEGFTLNQGGQSYYFPRVEPETDEVAEAATAAPLPEIKRQPAAPWPSFRGPATSGIGDGQGAPTEWDGASGANVLWKTPIPGIALSSPIVWGDRVFVTTAISGAADTTFRTGLYGDVDSVADDSEHTWKVYALDRKSGKIVWEKTAAVGAPKVRRHLKSSHANPTPVTDGKHLVVHFGSEGLFCYDFDGELQWKKELGVLSSGWFYDATYEWGFSSSPILYDGKVLLQTDIQKGSYIAALDIATGKELWRTERDEIPTWGTPNVLSKVDGSGAEIVTNGTTIRGYDADTGQELWTLGPNSEVTVGSPIIANGLAYVTGGYPPARPIYAIRPGGKGDLSLPEGEEASDTIAWRLERGGTYIPTPIAYEGHLYMLHNDGRLSVHDASSGEQIYRQRVGGGGSFSGSPVVADGKLYFTNEEGTTYVVRSGPVYKVLAENSLGEIVMTTPAISDGTMILRGMQHVFALGEPATEAESSQGSSR